MLINIPVDQITDNPFQRRQDYGDVAGLAADIQANGLLQPPLGRLTFDSGDPIDGYDLTLALRNIELDGFPAGLCVQLAFGHRRLRAYRHMETVDGPADVSQTYIMPVDLRPLTDDQMLNYVWSENQNRSDINPIEQAELLAEKLGRARAAGGNQQTVADEWKLDRSTIANKLRLLDLPAEVQTAVRARQLSERQAIALLPIVDLEIKLNGADDVKWDKGKKPEMYGAPITPAAFLTHAVANPDKATSDAIRDYARRAADHAGRPLPDHLAKYDAGEGEAIVQPLCPGCPRRHNQHCLQPTCLEAKWQRFQTTIPALAAAHTGLTWCDDPAAFAGNRAGSQTPRQLYDAGQRDGLVIGWAKDGYKDSWLTGRSSDYRNRDDIRADWRKGLLLGRLPQAAAEEEAETDQPPTTDWWSIKSEAETRRYARITQAFTDAVDRLLDDRAEHLRPLMFLFSRRSFGYTYRPDQPVADALHELVKGLYFNNTYPYNSWAALFTAIGLDPALIDPTDPADTLREQAADALIDWARNRGNAPSIISPISRALGQALNAFEAAGVTPDDDDAELAGLARWLPTAYAHAGAALNGRQ